MEMARSAKKKRPLILRWPKHSKHSTRMPTENYPQPNMRPITWQARDEAHEVKLEIADICS